MPPLVATLVVKRPQESPILDLTSLENPEPQAPQSSAKDLPVLAGETHGPRNTRSAPEAPVLNGFLTWLNDVDDKAVGSLTRAFYLTMQLAECDVSSFPQDSVRHLWERLRASLPLAPVVAQAIAEFVKSHPQHVPSAAAPGQSAAVQTQKTNHSTGSRGLWGVGPLRSRLVPRELRCAVDSGVHPNPCELER